MSLRLRSTGPRLVDPRGVLVACLITTGCLRSGFAEDPCAGERCSGHGVCLVTVRSGLRCACDPGFMNAGALSCERDPRYSALGVDVGVHLLDGGGAERHPDLHIQDTLPPDAAASDPGAEDGLGEQDAGLAPDAAAEDLGWHDDREAVERPSGGPACVGTFTFDRSSEAEPDGEYAFAVDDSLQHCTFAFVVTGAGGGLIDGASRIAGFGGRNSFDFSPHTTGVLRLVVGGGGVTAPSGAVGAAGGGASSVLFVDGTQVASLLSIAGGGGGGGTHSTPAGHGNGDGAGMTAGTCTGAPGDGSGGTSLSTDQQGGSCGGLCQGGQGGQGNARNGYGYGKGGGYGGSNNNGGGGGGGFGGGGGSRWTQPGCGGAGKIFDVGAPMVIVNTTDPGLSLGGGGAGGTGPSTPAEDGAIVFTLAP